MEPSWFQERLAATALWGRAEANTFLTSSITKKSPSFSRWYYILQILCLTHKAAISASDPLPVLRLGGCCRRKGGKKDQDRERGARPLQGPTAEVA